MSLSLRRLLLALGLTSACGGSSGPAPQVGDPCSRDEQGAWPFQCPGGTNVICEPLDACGAGFCSARCEDSECPEGSVCVALAELDPATLEPSARERCFVPCASDGSCPGNLTCAAGYDVCGSDTLFANLGSLGGHSESGGACQTGSPPDPAAQPRLFSQNHIVSGRDADEAAAAIGPDGTFYIAYNPGRMAWSNDGGSGWVESPVDDVNNLGDPALGVDRTLNRVYFAHLAFIGQPLCSEDSAFPTGIGVNISWSDNQGKTWAGTTTVSAPEESMGSEGVDKTWMLVVPTTGDVLVSYMSGSNLYSEPTSHATVARSVDHGLTFTRSEVDPGREGFKNLIQLAASDDGVVYASWWEAPSTATELVGEIRVSRSLDGGATWSPSVGASPPGVAAFDVPGLDVAADGSRVAVTWAQAPGGAGYDVQDVYASVSVDQGASFLAPVKVNSDASCATHWHPFPMVSAQGDVYVFWYDNRWDDARVVWARGTVSPGALSFAAEDFGFVTDAVQPFTTTRGQFFVGDYLGVVHAGTTALVAWGDLRDAATTGAARIYSATATIP